MEDLRKHHWTGVYDRKAEDEVSWFQASPLRSLDWIRESVAGAEAPIIDIGGGASRLVDELLAAGYGDVTVLDIAESALAKSIARLGDAAAGIRWVAADITTWTPDRQYDLWHDHAVFHSLW